MSKRYTIEEMQEKLDNMFPDEDLKFQNGIL